MENLNYSQRNNLRFVVSGFDADDLGADDPESDIASLGSIYTDWVHLVISRESLYRRLVSSSEANRIKWKRHERNLLHSASSTVPQEGEVIGYLD